MIRLRARYDGRVLVPEGKVELPVGTVLELAVDVPNGQTANDQSWASFLKELDEMPADENWPPDGAAQVDHYLYGHAKNPANQP